MRTMSRADSPRTSSNKLDCRLPKWKRNLEVARPDLTLSTWVVEIPMEKVLKRKTMIWR